VGEEKQRGKIKEDKLPEKRPKKRGFICTWEHRRLLHKPLIERIEVKGKR